MSHRTAHRERPAGHNSVNPFVLVKSSASDFIDFVVAVFDAVEHTDVRIPDRDGSLIHAEVQIGDATLMVADSKPDWPTTPAFNQVYVDDAGMVLSRAESHGATIVTRLSPFYGGVSLARFLDPWGNLWWLYEPGAGRADPRSADTSWHDAEPSYVYTTLMGAMRTIGGRTAGEDGGESSSI